MSDQEAINWDETSIENAVGSVHSVVMLKDCNVEAGVAKGLLVMRKELESEQIREVRVTWVDSNTEPCAINE